MMGRALMTSETRWGPPRTANATDGYRAVFQEHHTRLVRFAYLLSGDRHAADDLAADAFARVFPHWCRGSVDDPGAYLRRTVVNLVRERARRSLVRDIRPVAEPDPGPVDGVEGRTDERERLLAALRHLSEEQRLVIVLRFLLALLPAGSKGLTVGWADGTTSTVAPSEIPGAGGRGLAVVPVPRGSRVTSLATAAGRADLDVTGDRDAPVSLPGDESRVTVSGP